MRSVSVDELELLTFFEVEPTKVDSDIPWIYNELAYEYSQDDYLLVFVIAPSYKDVRLIMKHSGLNLYELNALGVEDVKYHNDRGRETLEVVVNDQDRLWIRLKPELSIKHEVTERI